MHFKQQTRVNEQLSKIILWSCKFDIKMFWIFCFVFFASAFTHFKSAYECEKQNTEYFL